MKTGIPQFLPEHKQEELRRIVELIEEKFRKVDTVILYGSYARNKWVEDKYVQNGTTYEYISDYDLLFLMNSEKKAQTIPFQSSIENAIDELNIETPISIIYHGYPYIVQMLEERRYFFCDIYKEGYIISNNKNHEFPEPQDLTYEFLAEKSEEYFDITFSAAMRFLKLYNLSLKEAEEDVEFLREASFNLHQATEKLYMTTLLVFTDYRPKIHNLSKLGKMVYDEDKRFIGVFPMTTPEEKHCFKLLKSAYIDSRYSKKFKITREELEYLKGRVQILKDLTEKICKEKIEYYKSMI